MPNIWITDNVDTEKTSVSKLGTPIVVDNDDDRLPTVWKPGFECNPADSVTIVADVSSGDVPLTVEFSATLPVGVTTPVTYAWDFGDGNTSNEEAPTHEYTEAGDYTVTLTVTNECGSAEDTHVIEVTTATGPLNLFVAVASGSTFGTFGGLIGDGQLVMTSPDGSVWSEQNSMPDVDGPWWDLCRSPELNIIVAVARGNTNNSAAQIMTSPDALTWTERTNPDGTLWLHGVCWSPELGLFIAVGQGTGIGAGGSNPRVLKSSDGITWTQVAEDVSQGVKHWRGVIWSSELSLFIACAHAGTGSTSSDYRIMTSPDGDTWTQQNNGTDGSWNALVSNGTIIVAVSNSGTDRIMTSPDGVNWTARTAPVTGSWIDITWAEELGLFIVVEASATSRIITSPDGINWTLQTVPVNLVLQSVAWNGSIAVAVALSSSTQSGNNNCLLTSPDGVNWTNVAGATDSQHRSWRKLKWV